MVIHRREYNIKAWLSFFLEDRSHSKRWLRADLVPPSPFLSVLDAKTDPAGIDRELRNAWMPFFSRADRRAACEDTFMAEVGGWLPRFPEYELSPLNGQMLNMPRPALLMVGIGWSSRPFRLAGLMVFGW